MAEMLSKLIEDVADVAEDDQQKVVNLIVATQESQEVALLLESLPVDQRLEIWKSVQSDERLNILVEMRSTPRESVIGAMAADELDVLLDGVDAEQLIELSESLPAPLIERALNLMNALQRSYYEGAQQYSDDQSGHWVDHQILILPSNARVKDALRLLRRELPKFVDTIFLINRAGHFSEAIRISQIIGSPDHVPLVDLSEEDFFVIKATDDTVDASMKVQKSNFSALPVVDGQERLIGRLNIGTASEIVNEYYERQLMATAGMDEDEDLFSPVIRSAKSRAIWLGINLLTAFLASWFIGLFEATLEQVVALAVLMPVVASMGGISGSQTLTLIIRGLALGQVTSVNFFPLLKKELSVGGLNGIIWSLVIGVVTSLWFQNPIIGIVIGLAILVNILAAAVSGVIIPVILDKLKLDPALSGSVILTTVTDIVGFVVFLGLGTLFLL